MCVGGFESSDESARVIEICVDDRTSTLHLRLNQFKQPLSGFQQTSSKSLQLSARALIKERSTTPGKPKSDKSFCSARSSITLKSCYHWHSTSEWTVSETIGSFICWMLLCGDWTPMNFGNSQCFPLSSDHIVDCIHRFPFTPIWEIQFVVIVNLLTITKSYSSLFPTLNRPLRYQTLDMEFPLRIGLSTCRHCGAAKTFDILISLAAW